MVRTIWFSIRWWWWIRWVGFL